MMFLPLCLTQQWIPAFLDVCTPPVKALIGSMLSAFAISLCLVVLNLIGAWS